MSEITLGSFKKLQIELFKNIVRNENRNRNESSLNIG